MYPSEKIVVGDVYNRRRCLPTTTVLCSHAQLIHHYGCSAAALSWNYGNAGPPSTREPPEVVLQAGRRTGRAPAEKFDHLPLQHEPYNADYKD